MGSYLIAGLRCCPLTPLPPATAIIPLNHTEFQRIIAEGSSPPVAVKEAVFDSRSAGGPERASWGTLGGSLLRQGCS